jgi:5'-nucleotidase
MLLVALASGGAAPSPGPQAAAQAEPFVILLSNDDGYDAPGLKALIEALRPLGEIYVSAPAANQSGKGHSIITTHDPIFVQERPQPNGAIWYALEAPPATCVRLAIETLLPKKPQLVISGINRGDNLGIYSHYLSGTIGAAREAAILGIPAIAVSMGGNQEADYAATAAYVRELVGELRAGQMLKPGFFLNVNRPAGTVKGVRVTRLSMKPSVEDYERRTSPRGRLYFWSRYRPPEDEEEGTDIAAFRRGYIALTPIAVDASDRAAIERLRGLERRVGAVAH